MYYNYKGFARAILKEALDGNDWDGGDIQDLALAMGILREVRYDREIHGSSEVAEPGESWYEFVEG